MTMTMRYKFSATHNQAINDLGRQYEKIMQKANRGSMKTKYRYAAAGARFVRWVQPIYKLQKLQNLADKHLIAYAQYLKKTGLSDKYVKNELSAIRYIHSITPNTRHELSDSRTINKEADLGPTPNNKASNLDQSWTKEELGRFCTYVRDNNHPKYALMAETIYNTGCRLEEISTLRKNDVVNALKTGKLQLRNTKGGRPRSIPLTSEARRLLCESIIAVPRGGYVFVPEGVKVHSYIQSVKDYIYLHRDEIQDPTRKGDPTRTELHFHGLRHSYAQNYYTELRDRGYTDREARREVSEALGHSRVGITFTYIKGG